MIKRSAALLFGFGLSLMPAMTGARAEQQFQYGPVSVAPLAKRLSDAVVNISTSQTVKGPAGVPLPKVPKGAPFEDFFDDFFNKRGGVPHGDRKISSLGSGFVIDGKEGLIVTNNHVIEGAEEIDINFHDGSKLVVDKIIGRDTKADLALLKVTPKKPLVDVKFGSSDAIEVGDWVMAIGNPFGLGGSVSVGIISAKSRDINSGPYDDYLQTDAAINKGNSGGPLFNMNGEVIGVNTAIISPTGGSIGIGFAVPSDTVANVVDQLKQYGEVRRGWLGVKIQSVTGDIAETLGLEENVGALVAAVTPESPASKAGLQPGDVILKFDGKDVTSMRGLPKIVAQAPIGKAVDMELLRKGKKENAQVTVGRLEDDDDNASDLKSGDESDEDPKGSAIIGLTLSPLNDELRKKYKLDDKITGVVVEAVDPQSAAAGKGLKPGDVIVEAAQDSVSDPEDVAKSIEKVKKAGRKAVLLRIEDSKGDLRFVAVPLS
ncbi:Do family serine endopeptidase [Hyphomicrobium sp.]|uniref:Do family serine endopeptidase n=1 Tax=Hyphomicrobium sp. TaxID=82 RepID=UPI000FBA6848|nr:Do family serine endopeptidase [Hyphomicrobium sp.]RUO99936.1 MAG: Do family serine endopeptidase [Hyphomicrobium sp.]